MTSLDRNDGHVEEVVRVGEVLAEPLQRRIQRQLDPLDQDPKYLVLRVVCKNKTRTLTGVDTRYFQCRPISFLVQFTIIQNQLKVSGAFRRLFRGGPACKRIE